MEKDQIYTQIKGHLQQLFEVDPESITLETNIYKDLGLDSIDAVDLVVQLQRATGKKIKPEEFKSVRTVGDIVNAVHELMQRP